MSLAKFRPSPSDASPSRPRTARATRRLGGGGSRPCMPKIASRGSARAAAEPRGALPVGGSDRSDMTRVRSETADSSGRAEVADDQAALAGTCRYEALRAGSKGHARRSRSGARVAVFCAVGTYLWRALDSPTAAVADAGRCAPQPGGHAESAGQAIRPLMK